MPASEAAEFHFSAMPARHALQFGPYPANGDTVRFPSGNSVLVAVAEIDDAVTKAPLV